MEKLECIVLATTQVGDSAVVVHTLSRDWGRRGFIVRGAHRSGMANFLPLNILEADIVENPRSDLWAMKNVRLLEPLNGIRGNIHKNSVSLFLSEVLFRTLRDGANEEGLYDWCVGSILTYNALEADFANFHLRFLLELAGALGFRPAWEDLAPFAKEYPQQLRALLQTSFSESMLLPLTGAQRSVLCEQLLQYLSYHTDQQIQPRSLQVLKELYR